MASSGILVHPLGASLAITASTTQTQAGGLANAPITNMISEITVSAGDADSVTLPAGQPMGTVLYIFNRDAAQDIKVWPNSGATVNGGTVDSHSVTVGQTQGLICVQAAADGKTWLCLLGAVCTAG